MPACLILDVELPDINGLDLQSQTAQGDHPQIVFITGHGDIPTSVRAIKAGAVDFLTKPFKEADLMRAIHAAIAQDRDARRKRAELGELRQRLSSLTPREREVLPLIVSGLLNKQAAAELGISEVTIQIHRGKIMTKMGAGSFAELVRMAGLLEIPMAHSRRAPGRATCQGALRDRSMTNDRLWACKGCGSKIRRLQGLFGENHSRPLWAPRRQSLGGSSRYPIPPCRRGLVVVAPAG